MDTQSLAAAGWYTVTEVTRPADTAATKWVANYNFNAPVVEQSWVETPKTQAEIDAEVANANYADLLAKIPAALANNQAAITSLQSAYTTLDNLSRASWANQTQRDNALKSNSAQSAIIAQHAIALTRQNNALMRIIGNLLDSQAGT